MTSNSLLQAVTALEKIAKVALNYDDETMTLSYINNLARDTLDEIKTHGSVQPQASVDRSAGPDSGDARDSSAPATRHGLREAVAEDEYPALYFVRERCPTRVFIVSAHSGEHACALIREEFPDFVAWDATKRRMQRRIADPLGVVEVVDLVPYVPDRTGKHLCLSWKRPQGGSFKMTIEEAIESLKKSLAKGDAMMGPNSSGNWSGGSFKAQAVRTLIAEYEAIRDKVPLGHSGKEAVSDE